MFQRSQGQNICDKVESTGPQQTGHRRCETYQVLVTDRFVVISLVSYIITPFKNFDRKWISIVNSVGIQINWNY